MTQSQVVRNVRARGYMRGTSAKEIVRQVYKIIEEVSEIAGNFSLEVGVADALHALERSARKQFDASDTIGHLQDEQHVLKEIADATVVLCCMMEAYNDICGSDYDIMQLALEVSSGDKSRGVRGENL